MADHNWPDADMTPDDIAYQEDLDRLPKPGTRVRLTVDVERYPHFIATAGMTGVVTEATDDVFAVRMDEHLPGSEDWDNEVHWYPRNCDEWPFGQVEEVRRMSGRTAAILAACLLLLVAVGATIRSEPGLDCGPEGKRVIVGETVACIDREPVTLP